MDPSITRDEVIVAGKRLETLWIEPQASARPTLVMLHEGLGSIALWKDFPQKLAARTGCGVLVYSRYGHGNSDKLMEKRPVRFMYHEGQVVLPELLDKLGIVKPVLIGHSDGGSISLIFGGRYPDAVSGLILEAPHVFVEDLSIASIAQAKITYETTDFPQRLGRYHANVDATFWGWNNIWLDPAFRSWSTRSPVPPGVAQTSVHAHWLPFPLAPFSPGQRGRDKTFLLSHCALIVALRNLRSPYPQMLSVGSPGDNRIL